MIKKTLLICLILNLGRLGAQNPDIRLLKAFNRTDMPAWDKTMKNLSASVYPVALISPFATWSQGYFQKDRRMMRNGYKSAVAIGLAMTLSTGLKYLVRRERPFVTYPNDVVARDHAGKYSFPSGHTTAAFATATALTLSYKKWYVSVPAYAYAGFVGYSRMRLGLHYPSDILGGMLAGIGSCLLTWELARLFHKNDQPRNSVITP